MYDLKQVEVWGGGGQVEVWGVEVWGGGAE